MGQALTRGNPELAGQQEKLTPAGNPLPDVIHEVLSAEQLGHGRVIMVGDVHGCCDELRHLLQQCQFDQKSDILIFNGDMVNKGPKSIEVIDYIQSLGAKAVRGNQDDKALAEWLLWKSGAPLTSHPWLESLTDDHARWLGQLPFSLALPSRDVLIVHAGMVPGVPLCDQTLETLTEVRTLPEPNSTTSAAAKEPAESTGAAEVNSSSKAQEDCKLESTAVSAAVPWASLWKGPQHVFFGHDAKRKLQTWPAATGLDTGCCYGGLLTACILPSAQEAAPLLPCDASQPATTAGKSAGPEARPPSKDAIEAAAAAAPTLTQLGASLVMVPARQVYHVKRSKGAVADAS